MTLTLDDPVWDSFFKCHPLRVFCANALPLSLLRAAETAAVNILQNLSHEIAMPCPPDILENHLRQQGILIEEFTDKSTETEYVPFFLSSCEPEQRRVALYSAAISRQAERINISVENLRALSLAHEWFHIIIFKMGIQPNWEQFAESERIIIEEAAARIFAVRLLGLGLHPAILDCMALPASNQCR